MYKNHNMTQLTLLMETSVLIPTNYMSRHVNKIVETIPHNEFDEFKHHRETISYHPKIMLKVILYDYTQFVFSGSKIEKLLNDSIRMMWLSQNQTPYTFVWKKSFQNYESKMNKDSKALYHELVTNQFGTY